MCVTPEGFTFNQFLVKGDETLLFHCGPRAMFPSILEAMRSVSPPEDLRWICFGHLEADECGSMNQWLAAAPHAEVAHGMTACFVSLNDLADRPPHPLHDGAVLDLGGGKRVRYIDTPHVPHGWEAGLLYVESDGVLLCGDLFTHTGDAPALTGSDILAPAMQAEEMFGATAVGPQTAPAIRRLAALAPRTLALMHGSSYAGDGAAALEALAEYYDGRLRRQMEATA